MASIGVLSPVTGGFYFGEVLAGIERVVARAGGQVTLVQTLDAGQTGDEFVPAPTITVPIGWENLDGFLAVAQASSEEYLHRLRAAGKPVVLVSNALQGFDGASVVADNAEGVAVAVEHLIEHGHRRIAFVGNLAQTDMAERHAAYETAMADHGLATEGLYVPTPDHVETGGAAAADDVLDLHREEQVTAVVASTDRIAIGLMRAVVDRGVRVPQDLAVVGFDDVETGWHTSPPLATVNQQIDQLGVHAARLLLAELEGAPVAHSRHSVPSTFIPRGSCGCLASASAVSHQGVGDARHLIAVISVHLGFDEEGDAPQEVDLEALDELISRTLHDLYPSLPSPETLENFTDTVIRELGERAQQRARDGLGGGDLLAHATVRTTTLLAHLQASAGVARAEHLARSLGEQYDVGMGLLGRVGSNPSDLHWLEQVDVRLGCLGLWEGDEGSGTLRIAGVYDPDGRLEDPIAGTCRVEQFPPMSLIARADHERTEVTYVVPVRGSSGDHGLLCVIGPVDTHAGTGRATYNHWAALLGVALKQQSLVEVVRRSEERYALAADATHDGLWDWDVDSAECFFSPRCREMLGTDVGYAVDPRSNRSARVDAPELGAWISRVHPDDRALLRAELTRAVREQQPIEVEHRIATGEDHRWVLCRAVPVGEAGRVARRVVGSLQDIHQRKELEEQLRHGALYDTVTGLPNRRMFLERLGWAVEQTQRGEGARFAVVFLDLDTFKLVNDSLGHLMGDDLLRTVGERLRSDLRSADTAARFGGDEFAVLLYGLEHEAVLSIVERIQDRIAAPITLGDQVVTITASIGIATSDAGYHDPEDVLRDADIAMYHAKENERGTASVFDPVMHTRATQRLRAQTELREALVREQFVVHYQPVVQLSGCPVQQFEALVRWVHPDRGLLLPHDFLPAMQETGTVVGLGQWVLESVVRQLAEWRTAFDGPVRVSVNLSHREFWADSLLRSVTEPLARHGVPPDSLDLEITESVIMVDPVAARQIMADLHATGVGLHIDDFGTGHSSLGSLRTMPVDGLKIDQSFIAQMSVDAQTAELVRIILEMGRTLGLDVVAEGVETPAQAERLRAMGCRTAQGWLYADAMPGDLAGALLGTRLDAGDAVGAP